MELGFWRVALRPGKPLMHGRLDAMTLLGLPGNPVSSIVCAILFLVPAIRALLVTPIPVAIRPNRASSARISPPTATGRITCARRFQPADGGSGRDCSRGAGFVDARHPGALRRAPRATAPRAFAKGRRTLQNHPSSALLLSVAPELGAGLAEHSENSYLVPALFQNRSTGWSSKGQPC